MQTIVPSLFAGLMLAACAVEPPRTASCSHRGPEPVLRPDLPARFESSPGHIIWPADDGFAPGTLPVTIQPGALLDRFGDNAGRFFSPKGTGYRERSLPYVCQGYAYTAYRAVKPLPVLLGTATPSFGEPGGAVQVETTACVDELLAAGVIQVITQSSPAPCYS